jgi:hypothetical protein
MQKERKDKQKMKIMIKPAVCLCAVITALVSGCQVSLGPAPGVVVEPGVAVEVAPPAYVWDGVEFVGEYNGQFMCFGVGGAWVVCDAVVLDRFHGWEVGHPDWRGYAIRNDGAYRLDRAHRDAAHRDQIRREQARHEPVRHDQVGHDQAHRPAEPGKVGAPEKKPAAPVKKTAPAKKTGEKKDEK